MASKGGGGYGGGPYGTNSNSNANNYNSDIPVVEATPVAEATYVPPTPTYQEAGGGGGTYARPPPTSPYYTSSSQQQQQLGQQPGQPQSQYQAYQQQQAQRYQTYHQQQQQQAQQQPQPVMGQPVPLPGQVMPPPGQDPQQQMVMVQVNPRQPFNCQCPHCGAIVTTELQFAANGFTWMGCLGLALLGCYPCCVLPFCMDDCKSAVHSCPRCKGIVAVA